MKIKYESENPRVEILKVTPAIEYKIMRVAEGKYIVKLNSDEKYLSGKYSLESAKQAILEQLLELKHNIDEYILDEFDLN